MRIALIDDDRSQTAALSEMIKKALADLGYQSCPPLSQTDAWDGIRVDPFDSGKAFLSQWKPGEYDVILLDIFMDQLSGVETSRQIRRADQTVRLVFCTSSNDFAAESYEVNAQYYLRKPVSLDAISAMLRRLRLQELNLSRTLFLPDGHPILLRQLLYTNYANHVVTLYFKEEEPYRLRTTQAQLEALLLPFSCFFSPIKGMIINFYETVGMTADTFQLSNGASIPVTRRKHKEAKEAYARFRFEKLRKEAKADARF